MKKHFALVVCFLFTMTTAFSQEHMLFRGVPIDGTVESFAQSLVSKGFTKIGIQDGNTMLSGKFTGRDVIIVAYSSPASKKVYRVGVIYQVDNTWSVIENLYNDLKSMLTQKYGAPALVNETTTEHSSLYSRDKLFALRMDKLIWESGWLLENGAVSVKMAHQEALGVMVVIVYEDKINTDATTSEYIDEL